MCGNMAVPGVGAATAGGDHVQQLRTCMPPLADAGWVPLAPGASVCTASSQLALAWQKQAKGRQHQNPTWIAPRLACNPPVGCAPGSWQPTTNRNIGRQPGRLATWDSAAPLGPRPASQRLSVVRHAACRQGRCACQRRVAAGRVATGRGAADLRHAVAPVSAAAAPVAAGLVGEGQPLRHAG